MTKQIAILLLLGFSSLYSINYDKTTNGIYQYTLPKNTLRIKANYNRINDSIDILNIKEKELGSGTNYGSIGDASGFDLSFAYGISKSNSFYIDFEHLSVNYNDTKLKNKKFDLYTKFDLYSNPHQLFQTFSIDLGYINNRGNDLDIKKASTLNSMVQKMRPGTSIEFNGSGIVYNGSTLSIIGPNGIIPPFIKIADLNDDSFYLKALTKAQFKNSILNLYTGFKSTSIDGYITIGPSDSEIIANALEEFGEINLKRDEKTVFVGFNYEFMYQHYIFRAGYEYLKIFGRESELDATDDNHIFNGSISRKVSENLEIFIGGKAMLNQFNGVIPYLYNRYTKHKYDKKYGYAKIGFIYNFNLDSLYKY